MEIFREFAEGEERSNWHKGIVSLLHFKKLLESFIDNQIDIFHEELRGICGQCTKNCNFQNWNPQPNQIPPLDCEVCSRWIEEIRANHTSSRGRVYWKNSESHLWSEDKWEVAKVFMTDGHKKHKSLGDFDIAALLCLMTQCKHFQRFKLGDFCQKVSHVRNNIMHSPSGLLKKEDLHSYLQQIKALGEALAKHDPQFERLSKDIDEIANLDIQLVISEREAQQEIHEDIEHNHTRTELDEDERRKIDPEIAKLAQLIMAIGNEIRICDDTEFQEALQRMRDDYARPTINLLWMQYGRMVIPALRAVADFVVRAFSVY